LAKTATGGGGCKSLKRNGGGQDSNLHSLSAGGFQDRTVGLNLIQPQRIYQYKSGCAAITVI
jgi:hypothetical protein